MASGGQDPMRPYLTTPGWEEGGRGLVAWGVGNTLKESALSFLSWPLPHFQMAGWLYSVQSEVALQGKGSLRAFEVYFQREQGRLWR